MKVPLGHSNASVSACECSKVVGTCGNTPFLLRDRQCACLQNLFISWLEEIPADWVCKVCSL